MIRKCYPNGKRKAFNATYDDGVLQDVRLVQLMNRWGIRGTFNLNSQLMESEFAWTHENGMTVRRLPASLVVSLYEGHEIASHTLTHPYLTELPEQEILRQMGEDKKKLEKLFGREVKGFAVPFDGYNETVARCARKSGFTYARMSEFSLSLCPWQDRYYWKCGVFHLQPELKEFVDRFLRSDEELALCQIVGHSYDLDAASLWDTTEDIFRSVSSRDDIWLATNLEIVDYLMQMNRLELDRFWAVNHSDGELWIEDHGRRIRLVPGEAYKEELI